MQPQQFELLGERLLRSGIAPRHVRRYLRELGITTTTRYKKNLGRVLIGRRLRNRRPSAWANRTTWSERTRAAGTAELEPPMALGRLHRRTAASFSGSVRCHDPCDGRTHANYRAGMELPFPTPLLEVLKAIRLLSLYALPVIAASGFAMLARRRGVSRGWAWASITLITFVGALPNLDVYADRLGRVSASLRGSTSWWKCFCSVGCPRR